MYISFNIVDNKGEKYIYGVNMKISRNTFTIDNSVSMLSFGAVVGKKEGEGPLAEFFDHVSEDARFGEDTFEKGESAMQKLAINYALEKGGFKPKDIDLIFAGDLLNQCISSSFGLRDFEIPFLGLYGACSTMVESLLLASLMVDNKIADKAMAVTSSHFCSAERQYRFPLEYGSQRTPTAQWTVTGSGATVLGFGDKPPFVKAVTVGKIVDLGVTDANNMGAAMAPAAADTILTHLKDMNKTPDDFAFIITGDLGLVGSELLKKLLLEDGVDLKDRHKDCGLLIFDREEQDVHAGASGCGCCASVLCGFLADRIREGKLKNILLVATGALMSPVSTMQGESIPGIAHAVWISGEK